MIPMSRGEFANKLAAAVANERVSRELPQDPEAEQAALINTAQMHDVNVSPIDSQHWENLTPMLPPNPKDVARRREIKMRQEQLAAGIQKPQVSGPVPAAPPKPPVRGRPRTATPAASPVSPPAPVFSPEPPPMDMGPPPVQEEAPMEPTLNDSAPEPPVMDPYAILSTIPGAPDINVINKWKAMYGATKIRFLLLEMGRAIVYRPLNYFEWQNQIQGSPEIAKNESLLRTAVLNRCLLWPRYTPEQFNALEAGLPVFIYNIIMNSSYFLDAGQAMMAVQIL